MNSDNPPAKITSIGVWIMWNRYWKIGLSKPNNGNGFNVYLGWIRGGLMIQNNADAMLKERSKGEA